MIWQFRNVVENFKQALTTYRDYLVFLLLIIASLLLLQTNENPQMTWVRQRVLFVAALLGDAVYDVHGSVNTGETIDRLRRENMELYKKNIALEDAYLENIRLRHLLNFEQRFPLPTVPAKVVLKDNDPYLSTLTLGKGRTDGIRVNQAVITSKGLVGKILSTDSRTSICETLQDQQFRVAGKIQRTRFEGIVFWEGVRNEVGFYGILKNLDVRLGDVVLTSEYSQYFQPNFKIGIVTEVNNEVEGLFKSIRVRTSVDFGTLEEVFVVTDTSKTISSRRGFESYFEDQPKLP